MSELFSHHSKEQKKRRLRRRTDIRIDMTPMVDVAFLLLTFFMITSAFRRPQTIEITIPADKESKKPVKVLESNICPVWIHRDGRLAMSSDPGKPRIIEPAFLFSSLQNAIRRNIQSNTGATLKDRNKLIFVFKMHPSGEYENMVYVLDELNRAVDSLNTAYRLSNRDEKLIPRFTFVTMPPDDTLYFRNDRERK